MAKRSDFAQKLLDDLRVRKERMSASQSSKSSKPIAADAYSYSRHAHKGSREMKSHQTTGLKSGSTRHKSTGGSRSLSIGEASKQIVPFERGRSSEQIADLSMALAFALQNGGKLKTMDSPGNSSVLRFLNQIGKRSVDMANMERSSIDRHSSTTRHFPTLSHLHIKEISKGAQKLNQILRACSNGVNFDRYSIEIGRELLKGAMELEESLRMLVNLQEASEYMIKPQSKTRITLLDDDDEDDNDIIVRTDENKQLARPMFSFDKPSRNSQYILEAARIDLKQRLMALTYKSENTNLGHDNHTLSASNSTSHRQSASYNPNVKTFTNHSSPSISKPESGRIPNVIAKLMGLEELPENDDLNYIAKKENGSKGKNEGTVAKKTAEVTHEWKTKDAGNMVSAIRKHKQMQNNPIQLTQDTRNRMQADRNLNLASQHVSFERTVHDGKLQQKDVEGIKPNSSSNKAKMKTGKHHSNIDQSNQSMGSQKDIKEKERKQDNPKTREQKRKEKGEPKEQIQKPQLQKMTHRTPNGSEAALVLQGQAEFKTMPKTETRDVHMLIYNNQPKSANNLALQQHQMLQNFESLNIQHRAVENEQQSATQKIQVRRQIRSESRSLPKKYPHTSQATPNNGTFIESTGTMQSMGFPNKRDHGDLVKDKNSPNVNVSMQDSMNRNSNQNSSPRNLNSEVMKEKNITTNPPLMEEKPVHLPALQKVKVTKVQKAELPRKIDELVSRRSGNPHNSARPLKHQTPMLQEVKQRRRNRVGQSKEEEQVTSKGSKEAEAGIPKYNKSVSRAQQPNMSKEIQIRPEQASNLYITPTNDECQSLKGPEIQAPNENLSSVINDQQGYEPDSGIDKHRSHSTVLDPLKRNYEGKIEISYPAQLENKKVQELETVEPLTESENHFKHILIKSKLFLNTAEALFKLNIPLDILHAGDHDCHDEESKIILDCGYEVMKRKGKRQELSVHPFMRISITSLKVRSLYDLIKQLHKDFEKLKYKAECIVEDYLPKMLEIDVYNRDLDVNCMWDFGWHEMMYAFLEKDDVIRDVERHVLNALLDEVSRDLLLVF